MARRKLFLGFIWISVLVLTGCNQSTDTAPIPTDIHAVVPTNTQISPTRTSLAETSTATQTPSKTLKPTSTLTPTPESLCLAQLCTYAGHFLMARPIAETNNDFVDATYRYGSTQEGARPTHHGVEFVNEEGTPVLAAADGEVIVAGNDYQETYAEFPYYYGNLVIIEHQFPGIEEPVYSLYGHLSRVDIQVGDQVQAGEQVGVVGYTGVAEWSHLHFEVRVGENIFYQTRNPELWLLPHENEAGELNGVLAGRIGDEFGTPIYIPNVVVERLGPEGEVLEMIYVETYADITVNSDNTWGENFAISDLLPGKYRVTFIARGLQVRELEIYPGQLTLMVFDASEL